ncbi:MAG: hypothetical protein R2697_09000 [Ilumatobacteraceae bacterium]
MIHALELLKPAHTVVVVGHGADQVSDKISAEAPDWANVALAEQVEQNGTGDATDRDGGAVGRRLRRRVDGHRRAGRHAAAVGRHPRRTRRDPRGERRNAATLLTSVMDDPTGYGRVIRGKDERVLRIVEQRDAAPKNSTSARSTPASTRSGATCSAQRCAT